MKKPVFLFVCGILAVELQTNLRAEEPASSSVLEFPPELVEFGPASEKPLLAGRGPSDWDSLVRERGWITREDNVWHLWFTGYNNDVSKDKFLGYATSADGLNWTRWPGNPLTKQGWVEDMSILKQGDTYYMFAEGRDDIAHLLISKDRVHWQEQWDLDIRQTNGQPISAGPRGTPTVWFENDTWWLLYERRDLAVYAATSKDLKVWTNVRDQPVIGCGPEPYDLHAVAVDQIIKLNGRYYAYYHASALPKWGEWSTCLAMSEDLVDWKKYPGNPIIPVNSGLPGASSGTVVHDGTQWRLYTTHPDVRVYFPKRSNKAKPETTIESRPVGTQGKVGCLANPKIVSRLEITKPGIYENYLVNAMGRGGNIVKITADNVTLRNCEIHNATGNAVGVFGTKVVIENCRIHHLLAGTFKDQHDAHGITGRWGDVNIRNCDISYTSGDSIQFDPDRASQGTVVIEDCNLWTGPLPEASLGFAKGERPGENAMDTKTKSDGPRCKLFLRNCYLHGWNQPAQIGNVAALNLKENVDAEVTRCVFNDNEIAFRVRGPGKRGGAQVTIGECAIYETQFGVRAEEKIEKLKISELSFGNGVTQRITFVNGKATSGYENIGERQAPAMDELLKNGFPYRR